jgi:soluble lytic murein transglycosylase-like protein/TolA-binding protein
MALAALAAADERGTNSEMLLLRSLCLDRVDRAAEASKGYEMYARGNGSLTDYALLFGAKSLKRQGYVAAGAKVLERLVQEWHDSPIWAEAALQLCEYNLNLERYESCAGVAELIALKAPKGADRRSGLYYLGRALEGAGRHAEAVRSYWKIVRDNPSHRKAGGAFRAMKAIKKEKLRVGLSEEELYRGGVALAKTGNYKEADATLQELMARGMDGQYWHEGVEQMARVSYARRRYTEASKRFALLVDAGGPGADKARLWVGKCELRAGRYKKAFEILETLGRSQADASLRADALWEAAREKESQGLVSEATTDYSYAASHLSHARVGPESCWRLGFVRYLAEDLAGAIGAFKLAGDVAKAPYLKAQSLYWLAKTFWRLDERAKAESALKAAAAEGPGVYYGARAAWILERDVAELDRQSFLLPGERALEAELDSAGIGSPAIPDSAGPASSAAHGLPGLASRAIPDSSGGDQPAATAPIETVGRVIPVQEQNSSRAWTNAKAEGCRGAGGRPRFLDSRLGREAARGSVRWHFARGLRLLSWGEKDTGAKEIRKAAKLGMKKADAIGALNFHGCYIEAMLVAGSPMPKPESRPAENGLYASFPLGFADHVWLYSADVGLDPFLVFSIIRQESRFDPDAVSGAGARGLMQIMPATGRKMSRELGIRWRGRSGLLIPETNIQMGAHYFAELYETLGNLPAALAAYNGGASKAREWALLAEGKGLDAYIEMIGYHETRKYVKLVILWYLTYLRFYHPEWIGPASPPPSIPSGAPFQQGH